MTNRRTKVECIECGGRMKVELISQNGQWIFASCPLCGHEISRRPNPDMRSALRRQAFDRMAFQIIITVCALLGVILMVEVMRRG